MSEISHDFKPLEEERPRVGKIYLINIPLRKKLNLVAIREKLRGILVKNPIKVKKSEDEEMYIPDIFIEDGQVIETFDIRDIKIEEHPILGDVLLGRVVMDIQDIITYRGRPVLFLSTIEVLFAIIRNNVLKKYYLVIMGKRGVSDTLVDIFRKKFLGFGLYIQDCELTQIGIDEVRKEIKGELVDTTLFDFADPTIRKLRFIGKGFQDSERYKEERKRGKVHQHMMYTEKIEDKKIVLLLSKDALVRFYTKTLVDWYLKFISQYIFEKLKTAGEPRVVMEAYTETEVLVDETEEESEEK